MYYPTDIESEIIRCDKFPADRARFYMVEIVSNIVLGFGSYRSNWF